MINFCLRALNADSGFVPGYRWLLALLMSCLLLSGCLAIPGQGRSPVDEKPDSVDYTALMAAGDEAYARTDLDTAQVKYALAVNRRPADVSALYKLGVVHYQKKSLEVAEEVLLRVVATEKRHILNYQAGALEHLGFIAILREDLGLAATRFESALQQQPERWRALNGLGVVSDMQSRHGDAQAYFRKALAITPGNAQMENNLGYSYYLQGNYAKAQSHFMKATRRNPDYKKAWSNLGLSLVRQLRYEEARAAFAKLAEAHVVSNNLGYLGMLQGDFAMAEAELTASQRQSPSYYGVAHENLALLRRRSRQQREVGGLLPAQAAIPAQARRPGTSRELTLGESAMVVVPASASIVATAPTTNPAVKVGARPASAGTVKKKKKSSSFVAGVVDQLVFLGYLDPSGDLSITATDKTEAIRSLQVNNELKATGRSNAQTRSTMKKLTVERLQVYLDLLGLPSTDSAGVYGKSTREAVRLYKKDHGLSGGAKLDSQLLNLMRERFS